MLDRYNRTINYLRISVTDRCNLRCKYCMPESGVEVLKHEDILSFEEITSFTRIAIANGIDKVRITGGEPLVRKHILQLVKMLSALNGLKDLSLTTNGILLNEFAKPLAQAGLNRVNISLDTINPNTFNEVTRGGDLSKVLAGIEAAKQAGLLPIKINCVIKISSDEPDAKEVKVYCEKNNLDLRFIHLMNLESGEFGIVEGGTGGNCNICNKLRLSSDGYLRPCLFNDIKFNVRELGPEKAIEMALLNKPECGTFSLKNKFNEIGG